MKSRGFWPRSLPGIKAPILQEKWWDHPRYTMPSNRQVFSRLFGSPLCLMGRSVSQGSLCLSTDRVWLDTCPTLTSPYVQPPHHILNLSLMCMSQWGKYWRKCHGQIGHQPLLYGCLSTKMAWSIILISISISVIWAWINLFVILVRHSVRKWLDWGNENNDSNEKVLE